MSVTRLSTRDGLYDDSLFQPRVEVNHSPLGLLRMTSDPQYLQLGRAALRGAICAAYRCETPALANGRCHRHRGLAAVCRHPGCTFAIPKNNQAGLCRGHREARP